MSHANAALTPRARLRLAQLVVDRGWTYTAAAKMFMVAPRTAKKWGDRYRLEGPAGMVDRSSRPHNSPTKTPPELVGRIVRLRWRQRLGPVQIAGRLGMQASTVQAVLVRCRINRLSHIDRVTGEPLRRYEHPHSGSLIHVDVTKFGNIPDGGGWRFVGRQQGRANGTATAQRTGKRGKYSRPIIGTAFVHTVIDDHSRIAYAEICSGEKASTAIGVLQRAVTWFADRGVTVERVLSDNGSCYHSHAWRDACAELALTPQADPALSAADQRQDRALPPHACRWLGLRKVLRVNRAPRRSSTRLAPLLQSPPRPLRDRRPATDHPPDQPPRTSHLTPAQNRPKSQHAARPQRQFTSPSARIRHRRNCASDLLL